jgi:predicted phage terminase large subunit-like protein
MTSLIKYSTADAGLKLKLLAEKERRMRAARRDVKLPLNFDQWLKEVSPSFRWDWQHLVYVRKKLEPIGTRPCKIMIFMPPRHGKSEQVTVRYPAYHLEKFPDDRVIVGCYNQTLANKFSRKTRKLLRERIPLSNERTAVEDWETMQNGGYRAVGVGGGITGQGGNLVIIDDPVKSREEANSEAYRNRLWDWYTDDLYTRLEPNASLILIQTRWHQDDLAGRILDSDDAPNWEVINFPALAEENDPLGRAEGEALCPDRYDVEALLNIQQIQKANFQALYQQRPTAVEGAILKREYWRYYKELPETKLIVQSWDTAFKAKTSNDYSACLTVGVTDTGFYGMDRWKARVEFPELKRAVIQKANEFNPNEILIEDKASGQSLIQELRRETRLPIIAIQVDTDKIARANASTGVLEAGKFHLPEKGVWVLDFIDNCAIFPNGAHDDDVDTLTQFLSRHGFRQRREFLIA